jgi:hypothetical protein
MTRSSASSLALIPRDEVTTPAIVAALPELLTQVTAMVDERARAARFRAACAGMVFAYWAHLFDHRRSRLDLKRDRLIQQRLVECDDCVSELLWALDMAAKDDWVRGNDPRSRHPNDSIEYLLRDRGMIEKFGERSLKFRAGEIHPLAKKHLGEHAR